MKMGYEQKGIVVHMYRLVDGKKFYFTKDELYLEDRSKAAYERFENVEEFNSFLEKNIKRLITEHGEDIRFEKRRRCVKKAKKN